MIFYAPLRPGNLMLCECADGRLRIFRDDVPPDDPSWETRDVARAIVAYPELKAAILDGQR